MSHIKLAAPTPGLNKVRLTKALQVDLGLSLSIRPLPDDPIEAAAGSLAGPGPTSDEMRRQWREEELEVERRKQSRRSSTHLRSSRS